MYLCERGIDSVQSLDSEGRCTCVRGVLILSLSTNVLLDFGTVSTMQYLFWL
jgi:hypothetical protein